MPPSEPPFAVVQGIVLVFFVVAIIGRHQALPAGLTSRRMKVILFGATGMVGQGSLRECLLDPGIESVLAVGRSPIAQRHPKLREILRDSFLDYSAIESQLTGYDACFFCLGVSSVGMSEERYRHLTYDITLAAATALARLNPQMVFVYVSGQGTDSTEQGRLMWARVKGKTENDLLQAAVQGGLHVSPRRDPAAAWHQVEDRLDSGDLCRRRAAVVAAHIAWRRNT